MFAADIQAEAGRWERTLKEDYLTPEEDVRRAEEHALAMTSYAADASESIVKAKGNKAERQEILGFQR